MLINNALMDQPLQATLAHTRPRMTIGLLLSFHYSHGNVVTSGIEHLHLHDPWRYVVR